jgi:glucose-6-phosphate-specific signal transduction histidine kinase
MGKRWWTNDWLLQLGVAVGYGLLYFAIHPLSSSYWPIHAGVRLACLLLVPYRYWFALLVGEAIPNEYAVFPCLDSLGPTWVAIRSIPPFAVAMPVVWACRTWLPPFPSKNLVDIKALLVCGLLVSISGMGYSTIAHAVETHPTTPFAPISALGFFLGPYLAILSIVPWVLMVKVNYERSRLREQFNQMFASRLFWDTLALVIPAFVVLTWMNFVGGDEIKQVASLAMFLPMAWLTLKHGWRAIAIAGPLAIACTALVTPALDDFNFKTYAIQTSLAIGVTCLFALGGRISVQLMQEESERNSTLNVQRLARQSLQLSEQRMRQTSQALEYLAGTLHITNGRLLDQMRRIVPNVESHAFYKQAIAAQNQVYRLAESMHPVAWRERGLPAALNETVARALDEADIAYRCEINGRGFTRLAPAVLTATYRTACEAIVYVTSRLACTRVNLQLRGGETHGKRWVMLRVEGVLEETGVASAVFHSEERKRLAGKLGASMLDIPELRDHVRIFDGSLHVRMPSGQLQITALLHDAVREEQGQDARPAPPLRLWVK